MSRRLDRVTNRGLDRLEDAIKESGGALSKEWIERDPDQAAFSQADDPTTWFSLMDAASGSPEEPSDNGATPERAQLATPLRYDHPVRLPPRPWGSTRRRARAWGGVALVVILLSAVGVFDYGLGVVLVLALAACRAGFALWENVGPGEEA
jgi:hypothetical protein